MVQRSSYQLLLNFDSLHYCVHGGIRFLPNVGKLLPDHTASHITLESVGFPPEPSLGGQDAQNSRNVSDGS
jgi:hypothetical protein